MYAVLTLPNAFQKIEEFDHVCCSGTSDCFDGLLIMTTYAVLTVLNAVKILKSLTNSAVLKHLTSFPILKSSLTHLNALTTRRVRSHAVLTLLGIVQLRSAHFRLLRARSELRPDRERN